MDPSIINTIITAFVSILTCLIGLHAGRKDSGSPSMKKVSEQQLEQLFLPMERLLSLGCQQDAKGLMSNLFQIIYSNLLFVPPVLLAEFRRISAIEDPMDSDFSKLREIVSSFYNWTRKALGYPYDKAAIKRRFIPTYERNAAISQVFLLLFLLLWASSLMPTFMAVVSKDVGRIPSWLTQFFILIAFIGTPIVITFISQSKRR